MKAKIHPFLLLFCSLTISFGYPLSATPAEEIYQFERMWPTLLQPWYFSEPEGVAIDNNGHIYVLDTGNNRVMKFTLGGEFVAKWGKRGDGDGEFLSPAAITVDTTGYVYVADTDNNRIQKFTTDGRFVGKWGSLGVADREFNTPRGIAVDKNGFIYVADTENHRIQKFNSDGQFVTKWGRLGNGDGVFNSPSGVAVDETGNVYVVENENHRIQKFTPSGQFVVKWGNEGTGDGEFEYPYGLTIDSAGYIYVTELSDRIQKFTTDGQFITKWGTYGGRNGEFTYPHGIAIDSNGYVYVADTSNQRIQKFTSSGQFVTKFASSGNGDGEFNQPLGIAIDSTDYVYVADSWNDRIQKFSSEGQFVSKWGSYGSGDGDFENPSAIAIDSTGYIYVAELSDRIQKFTSNGQFITKWGEYGSENGQFTYPHGMAVDSNNYIYVADTGNHRIQKFTTNGQFITKWGSEGSGDGEFNNPVGIATDRSNYVYVADTYNNRIQKFTSDGQFVTKWGSQGGEDGELTEPTGLAIDSSDYVYVGDNYNFRIQKFTSDGQFVTKWGSNGNDPGMFFLISAVALDSRGRVLVSEQGNHRIQVFSTSSIPPPGQKVDKAVIVAGGGPFAGNNIWDATQLCANFAYRALTYQGFPKENIYYLSADLDLDLDGNGILDDVDGDATNANFQSAITTWAQNAKSLFVYMVDHGGNGTFRTGATELLQASELDSWLDTIQGTIPGKVIWVYEACRSGSFIPTLIPPTGKERILITSAAANEEAVFTSQGTISFSFLFWGRMFSGDSFYDSFVHAKSGISVTYNQNPQLDGNGNGVGNERGDQDAARAVTIGNETRTGADIPVIGNVSPPQTLYGTTSALIYAANVIDADGIGRVWGVITPPSYSTASPDTPVTNLPILEMNPTGNNRYEGTYLAFNEAGAYNIAIYAMDPTGIISLPKQTTVSQQVTLNVSALATDVTGSPAVNTPVAITFTAQGTTSGTLYYQYWLARGYQTQDYGHWQMLQDWSTDNTLNWIPTTNDHYVVVAYVAEEPNTGIFHQAGLSTETDGNSANPIQITGLTTTMNYPQSTGASITLNTTASGGNGQLYYKYWYCKGIGGPWNVIQEYSTSRSCTWTPTEDGLYTVVVWVTDDPSGIDYAIAGMTCTIGE